MTGRSRGGDLLGGVAKSPTTVARSLASLSVCVRVWPHDHLLQVGASVCACVRRTEPIWSSGGCRRGYLKPLKSDGTGHLYFNCWTVVRVGILEGDGDSKSWGSSADEGLTGTSGEDGGDRSSLLSGGVRG